MFPKGFVSLLVAALLCSAVASIFILTGTMPAAAGAVLAFVLLMGMAGTAVVGIARTTGTALLVAILGLGFAFGMHPALADAVPLIVAPPGDTGLWASVNGYIATGLATIVTAAVSWAATAFATHTKIKIRADQEASIRETLLTGAYAAMHNLELAIDDHWTPAQRQKVIDNMVVWVEQRAAAQLKKLGLPNFVVNAMAGKVLGQLQGFGIGSDSLDALIGGGAPASTGNPGETPALDRAVGGNGGA